MRRAVAVVFIASLLPSPLVAGYRQLDQRYPVQGPNNLSPPVVKSPIHDCAQMVYVSGFIPGAMVNVYAGASVVATKSPLFGFDDFILSRQVHTGEQITATQTWNGITSAHSIHPVSVTAMPALTKPAITSTIYACGQVVPVGNLVPSSEVTVTDTSVPPPGTIGHSFNDAEWWPAVTSPLVAGHAITATQSGCTTPPTSEAADPATVRPEPSPIPMPTLDPPVVGNDAVTMRHLFTGAVVRVTDGRVVVGGGLATGESNWAHIDPAVASTSSIEVTQKLCTTSDPTQPATPVNTLPPLEIVPPICPNTTEVTIRGTVIDAIVVLLLNDTTVIGYGGAVPGDLVLSIPPGTRLYGGDAISARQYTPAVISPMSNHLYVACDPREVVTQHNDNFRTGAYLGETVLTPDAVLARRMRVKYTAVVGGGGAINGQPLYLRGVRFPSGTADALYVANTNNEVGAYNAETGTLKWPSTVTLRDFESTSRSRPRGIMGTPVIDPFSRTLYVLYSTKNQELDGANCPQTPATPCPHCDDRCAGCTRAPTCDSYEDQLGSLDVAFWLVALDARTGAVLRHVKVAASARRGDGSPVNFVAKNQVNRPALLLDGGSLYLAFGMRFREEIIEYHGWVIRYRASDFAPQGAFCTTVDATVPTAPYTDHVAEGAGIWQGGGGLAADSDGAVYFLTGNSRADAARGWYGDSFLRLTPGGSTIVYGGSFTPANAAAMEEQDLDLGSGGPMVVPGSNLVVGGGKTGMIYALGRTDMSLQQSFQAFVNSYHPDWTNGCPTPNPPGCANWEAGPHLHGSPTYWRGPDRQYGYLYHWSEKDRLKQFRFDTTAGSFIETPFHVGAVRGTADLMPGGMISLSARQDTANTGIIWATLPTHGNDRLYAFHAESLAPLWDGPFPDSMPKMGHWMPPTIADGKVVVATTNGFVVYEMAPVPSSPPPEPRTSWTPFQPTIPDGFVPFHDRFESEEAIALLPAMRRQQLAPPPDQVVLFRVRASVDQREAKGERFDGGGRQDMTWKMADGSRVIAEEAKQVPAPDKGAPPWQLFKVTAHKGKGRLGGVNWIQRIDTDGTGATYAFYGARRTY